MARKTPVRHRNAHRRATRKTAAMTLPKNLTRRAVNGGMIAPLVTADLLDHTLPYRGILTVAAVTAVITIQIVGSQLTALLRLAAYSRMLAAVTRAGISHAQDMGDIHQLMTDLRKAHASLQPGDETASGADADD